MGIPINNYALKRKFFQLKIFRLISRFTAEFMVMFVMMIVYCYQDFRDKTGDFQMFDNW